MFEFFDEYDDGVPEPWAKDIMACVLISVNACHEVGVCHRDLKPENILISFDTKKQCVVSFKLCDFGLGSEFDAKVPLTDFCGSPGFFCPEMITHGCYFGDKADVWSMCGIMLELILGNERFTSFWMGAYEYEVMQSKDRFTKEIQATVKKLPERLPFTGDLKDFILQFSRIKPSDRPTVKAVMGHPWITAAVKKMQSFKS
jgi:serine/threonine protein kinase